MVNQILKHHLYPLILGGVLRDCFQKTGGSSFQFSLHGRKTASRMKIGEMVFSPIGIAVKLSAAIGQPEQLRMVIVKRPHYGKNFPALVGLGNGSLLLS